MVEPPVRRSPLHPKALTPLELRLTERGNPIVLCAFDGNSKAFKRMDVVRFLGMAQLWMTREGPINKFVYVVLDNVPAHLRAAADYRYYQLGLGVLGVDIDTFSTAPPTKETRLTKGYGFRGYDLGLVPDQGEWSNYCLVRTTDM